MREDGLDLRRVLRRRHDLDVAVVPALGPGGLRLEIEVLLPAAARTSPAGACGASAQRRRRRRRDGCDAARCESCSPRSRLRTTRRAARARTRPRRASRPRDRSPGRIADDQRDQVAVEQHLVLGEQGLVLAHGADVVLARDVFGEEDRGDARASRARLSASRREDLRVRVRRHHRPQLERLTAAATVRLIVDVDRAGRSCDRPRTRGATRATHRATRCRRRARSRAADLATRRPRRRRTCRTSDDDEAAPVLRAQSARRTAARARARRSPAPIARRRQGSSR